MIETPNFEAVANQFVDFYYETFDNNRPLLQHLYRDHSMLTWESETFLGAGPILNKLTNLNFKAVKHQVATKDPQPNGAGGIVILVTGFIKVDEESEFRFSQTFQLQQDGPDKWFVLNDLFKLQF